MILLSGLILMLVATSVGVIYGDWQTIVAHRTQINRMWQMIDELEADKRDLTESLTRSQGKTYISTTKGNFPIPSDGWFDGATRIEVKK